MTDVDYDWFECPRCGKIAQEKVRFPEPEYRRLMETSICKTCSMDLCMELDKCPHTIALDNGSSACSLTWHHTGRCQPYTIDKNLLKELRDAGSD